MQEIFEKIKERLKSKHIPYLGLDSSVPYGTEMVKLFDAIEIVNQVESEYQSTVGQVKCDASFSDGYIKAIDDAIEKFLEYECFMIQWNPKLSKEKLVTDVMSQVKGQVVYNLEKMKQKAEEYGTDINVGDSWKTVYDKVLELEKEYAMSGAIENVNDCIRLENLLQYFKEELREEYNQSLANNNQSLTNGGWIPCSERLPEMFKYVLVWCKGRFVNGTHVGEECKNYGIGIVYNKWEVYQSKDIKDIEVIAWQPLPEPYKPGGE